MRAITRFWFFTLLLLMITGSALADPGIIYGKIYTVDDEVLEGFIRWDKNEVAWDDVLDGDKELKREARKKYRHRYDDFVAGGLLFQP